jgi:23S rRNA pseudouridine1911/1915/1917 synthase
VNERQRRRRTERVPADLDGERADVVLGRLVPGLSRRAARRLGLEGRIAVNGRRSAPSQRVHTDQEVQIELDASPEPPPPPRLLRTTERFHYVHKPSGVHTVAHTPDEPGCLATAVARHHPECAAASDDPREAGAVHRLDRPTSGVVAFARDPETWRMARHAFTRGTPLKHYLAVCAAPIQWPPEPEGALLGWVVGDDAWAPPGFREAGEAIRVRAPIGRGSARATMAVRLEGATATTAVVPVIAVDPSAPFADGHERASRSAWLFALRLETGSRHQARVHLSWAGAPIMGDERYGGPSAGRLHLHALSLDLSKAFDDETMVVDAPAPQFFDSLAC